MERFSDFTLSNGKIVYIDVTKIGVVKEITTKDTDARTMIYLSNGCGMDPYPVQEDIDNVMYSIDMKENPEFYKAALPDDGTEIITGEPAVINPETKIGSVTLKDVLIQIRNVCGQIKDCQYCPFCEFDGYICNCVFHETYPEHWEIESMKGV